MMWNLMSFETPLSGADYKERAFCGLRFHDPISKRTGGQALEVPDVESVEPFDIFAFGDGQMIQIVDDTSAHPDFSRSLLHGENFLRSHRRLSHMGEDAFGEDGLHLSRGNGQSAGKLGDRRVKFQNTVRMDYSLKQPLGAIPEDRIRPLKMRMLPHAGRHQNTRIQEDLHPTTPIRRSVPDFKVQKLADPAPLLPGPAFVQYPQPWPPHPVHPTPLCHSPGPHVPVEQSTAAE